MDRFGVRQRMLDATIVAAAKPGQKILIVSPTKEGAERWLHDIKDQVLGEGTSVRCEPLLPLAGDNVSRFKIDPDAPA